MICRVYFLFFYFTVTVHQPEKVFKTPHTVLALLARALGWDDPHQLKQRDGGHPDDHLLGGKKRSMLLPKLFVAH